MSRMDYKQTKWAKRIISLQDEDGKWGWFHTQSKFSDVPMTTEFAIRRLKRLGYTIEDDCIAKAVRYMDRCLRGECMIPDRREKRHNWDIFTSLILAVGIREFTARNDAANMVAGQWAQIITAAFSSGEYDHDRYCTAYKGIFGEYPRGDRLVDFVSYYQLSLLSDMLDDKIQSAMLDHVLACAGGVYYVYGGCLLELPDFHSRYASTFLAAMEIISRYSAAADKLSYVTKWLYANRRDNGMWDMGKEVNDKVYFPLSDDWRRIETRQADCTYRISALLRKLT